MSGAGRTKKGRWRSGQGIAVLVLALLLAVSLALLALLYFTPAKARPVSKAKPLPTVEVKPGKLAASLTVTGNVESESSTDIPVPSVGDVSVITKTPAAAGKKAPYCRPVLEVSGHPVFLLTGGFPLYRDLSVGDRGPDVRQVQAALRQCGYRLAVDGILGTGTQSAIAHMYSKAGYAPHKAVQEAPKVPPTQTDAKEDEDAPPPPPPAQPILPRTETLVGPPSALISKAPQVGQTVGEGTVIGFATGGHHVKLSLRPEQVIRLEAGQKVAIDGGSWQAESTIAAIPTQPDPPAEGQGEAQKSFTIILPLTQTPPAGATSVQCTIAMGNQQDYPKTLPLTALHYEGDKTVVYVLDPKAPDKRRRVEVTVTETGDTAAAIEGPIEPGTRVYADAKPQQ